MTEKCLPVVSWLKSWFTPKDEDYHYSITASDYNPNIGTDITITVTVTDGNDNLVNNHSFILNANGTNVSLTTNSNGVATHTYTCSSWGVCRFSIKTYVSYINIGNPYPVGSIYMSVTNTNPATLFGGTWVQLENRFLLGAGSSYTNGSTGGSKDAVVVEHNHTQDAHNHAPSTANYKFAITTGNISAGTKARKLTDTTTNGYYYVVNDAGVTIGENGTTNSKQPTINNRGESGTDKNMPPYLVVYMWKRTA